MATADEVRTARVLHDQKVNEAKARFDQTVKEAQIQCDQVVKDAQWKYKHTVYLYLMAIMGRPRVLRNREHNKRMADEWIKTLEAHRRNDSLTKEIELEWIRHDIGGYWGIVSYLVPNGDSAKKEKRPT